MSFWDVTYIKIPFDVQSTTDHQDIFLTQFDSGNFRADQKKNITSVNIT